LDISYSSKLLLGIKSFLGNLLDFVFPKVCILSEKNIAKDNTNQFIDDEILSLLKKLELTEQSLLKRKIDHSFAFSLYVFEPNSYVQKLIHSIKYEGFKSLGIFSGELLGKELLMNNLNSLKNYDCIIPVPLHISKQRERGYNQSELIAKGLSGKIGVPVNDKVIQRIKNTKSQTHLSIEKRKANVENAFQINKEFHGFINCKKVILVDDVITTGSTMKELLKTVKKAKAESIFVLSLANAE